MRDLRKYANQTTFRLLFGGVILVFVIGIGLIWIIYGREAAIMGLICLIGGLLPVGLILLVFWVIDYIVKRERNL